MRGFITAALALALTLGTASETLFAKGKGGGGGGRGGGGGGRGGNHGGNHGGNRGGNHGGANAGARGGAVGHGGANNGAKGAAAKSAATTGLGCRMLCWGSGAALGSVCDKVPHGGAKAACYFGAGAGAALCDYLCPSGNPKSNGDSSARKTKGGAGQAAGHHHRLVTKEYRGSHRPVTKEYRGSFGRGGRAR